MAPDQINPPVQVRADVIALERAPMHAHEFVGAAFGPRRQFNVVHSGAGLWRVVLVVREEKIFCLHTQREDISLHTHRRYLLRIQKIFVTDTEDICGGKGRNRE